MNNVQTQENYINEPLLQTFKYTRIYYFEL
jgi:hypothetical protein